MNPDLTFVFYCSCEVLADGTIWCCDVCSTEADPEGQLLTEESDRRDSLRSS